MSGYVNGVLTTKGIEVPPEFSIVPALVDLLGTLDAIEHPRPSVKSAEPVNPYPAPYGVAPVKELLPADAMRTYLVSWHNQLVTAQRAKSDAEVRALGFQKTADSLRRELDGEKERVTGLRKSVDLSHEAQSKLKADVDSLTVQNESLRALLEEARTKLAEQQPIVEKWCRAAEAGVAAGRKSAQVRKSRKAVTP
jgi:hypothetical protein